MITDDEVRTVARAIAAAHGFSPDALVLDLVAEVPAKVPAWLLMRQQAITHIAAFRAIARMEG